MRVSLLSLFYRAGPEVSTKFSHLFTFILSAMAHPSFWTAGPHSSSGSLPSPPAPIARTLQLQTDMGSGSGGIVASRGMQMHMAPNPQLQQQPSMWIPPNLGIASLQVGQLQPQALMLSR